MNLESDRTFNFPTGFHLVLINYLSHLAETPLWSALISDSQNPCNLLLFEAYSRLIGERECPLLHLLLSQFINFIWSLVVLSWKQLFHSGSFLPLITLLTCPLQPPSSPLKHIYCSRVLGRPFGSTNHLSCSTWLWPSLAFLPVAWSHSISPCPFGL